jgi:hypothetical protein
MPAMGVSKAVVTKQRRDDVGLRNKTPEGATKSVIYRPKTSGPTTNVIYLVSYFFGLST